MSDLSSLQSPLMVRAALEHLYDNFGVGHGELPEHEDMGHVANAKRCELLTRVIFASRSFYIREAVKRRQAEQQGPVQVGDDLRVPAAGILVEPTARELQALAPALDLLHQALGDAIEPEVIP